MKLIIFILCSVFFISCEAQEINTVELRSENKEKSISSDERNLIRTFDNDYSLWHSENKIETYEDLSENLGVFNSFKELREAQYRSKGILTELTSIKSIINSRFSKLLQKTVLIKGGDSIPILREAGKTDNNN